MDCLVSLQPSPHPLPRAELAISLRQGVEIARSTIRTMTTRPGRLRPQSGFSLVELMIAITVAGLTLGIALPKLREGMVSRDVKSARSALANMYARARVNALQTRKPTTVHFSGSEVWVTAPMAGGLDTVGAVMNLTVAYGVSVIASEASIRVLPSGLANMAAPVTVKVSRGGKVDSVMVTGYGRLQ